MRTMRIALAALLLAAGTATVADAQQRLPRSTPEAEGVSSQGIEAFLDAVAQSGFEVHSFMLLRHGKVVAEGWWQPYAPELRHVMFSASKSITSLGVGIAADEGKLKLDDRVISFFPEYAADDSISPPMQQLTVRHLLTMSVGQQREAMRGVADWVLTFLRNPPVHEPGTVFMYNNMASFMLSAIVQQATGQRLFDYLQPRLFRPLGMENITWDYNPQGITVGMIGSRLHTEDLAKLGQLMLQKGKWNGRQLVSRAYVEAAAAFHIGTNTDNVPADRAHDGQQGYGYQFWRGKHDSFRIDGMGGQLSVVLPNQDAVVVLTGNVRVIPDELALVGQHLVPAFQALPLPPDPAGNARLKARLAALQIPPASHAGELAGLRAAIGGKRFALEQNPQGIQAVSFAFPEDRCALTLDRGSETRTLEAGLGAWRTARLKATSLAGGVPTGGFRRSSNAAGGDTITVAALSCGLRADGTLEFTARFVEDGLGAETWTAVFDTIAATVRITTGPARPGGPPPSLHGRVAQSAVFTAPVDSQWQKGANTHRLSQFPRLHPDGRVWFQFQAPRTAQSVVLHMGGQRYRMQQDSAGRWNVIIPRAEPGFQAYSFVVDGTSIRDPGSTAFYVNGVISALEYPAADADFYMPRPVPHGDTREHWFYSKVSGSWRRMVIYTPPGYEKDSRARYPVLYLQHGGGEDESEWTHGGRANFILDNLIAAGRARPMIVVMNNGFVARPGQAAATVGGGYQRGFAAVFQEFLLGDVIPEVDASYRTIPDAKHRALAGLSMGGGQSFYIGLENPRVFGSVGLFSTGVFGGTAASSGAATSRFNAEEHVPGLLTRSKALNDALDLFYISVGEQDPRLEPTRSAVTLFREHGLKVEFASFPGDHEWRAWRKSLEDFAQRLFRH